MGEPAFHGLRGLRRQVQPELAAPPEHVLGAARPLDIGEVLELAGVQARRDLGAEVGHRARIAEQVRAGIQSLPRGQRDAALALGMHESQVYRRVILPVALRIMMPALTSEAMSIVKNSSVAFVVAVAELTQFAMQAQEETARGIEIYLAVTLLYALTAFAVNRVLAAIESRIRVPGVGALARQGA
ncbi:MAG: ABC transporter permease subunit [Gammaproteobacteria bacterium]|nr:ABC transporter permease subunit [Gammaproteobacteria bacterium]